MPQKSDRELVAEIKKGRTDALEALFDRYGSLLYEFIYRIVGDRDQAARLVEQVFKYIPAALKKLNKPEMVKGWLYAMGREASQAYLREKDWLNALPPTTVQSPLGFVSDIENAARAMPASLRAVLIIADLKDLTPAEKLRALNVSSADLTRLEEEARRAFNIAFSAQSAREGRPLASSFEPDRILGVLRRVGPTGSLLGHLPPVTLPDSITVDIRSRIGGTKPRTAPAQVSPEEKAREPAPTGDARASVEQAKPPVTRRALFSGSSFRRAAVLIAVFLVLSLAIVVFGPWSGYFAARDPASPLARLVQFRTSLGMPSAGCITGIVADEHGEHLSGWSLALDWTDENKVARHLITMSDRNGWFWFPGLKTGLPYAVSQVMQPDWKPVSPTTYAIVLEGCPELVFKNILKASQEAAASASGCITGIVADEHGDHLPGWTLTLVWTDENYITRTLSTVSDKNGWFWFPDLKLGLTYTLGEMMQPSWEAVSPTHYTFVLDGCPESIFKNRIVR